MAKEESFEKIPLNFKVSQFESHMLKLEQPNDFDDISSFINDLPEHRSLNMFNDTAMSIKRVRLNDLWKSQFETRRISCGS